MNFGRALLWRMEEFSSERESQFRILYSNLAGKFYLGTFRNDQASRARLACCFKEFFVFDVGDISGLGRFKTGDAFDQDFAVAHDLAADVRGHFSNCLSGRTHESVSEREDGTTA